MIKCLDLVYQFQLLLEYFPEETTGETTVLNA